MSEASPGGEGCHRFLGQLEAGVGTGMDGGGVALEGLAGGMPAWLAQVVGVLFEGQETAAARRWARRVHGELVRLGGRVPFGVVHDWHARTVAPMLAEAGVRRGGDGATHEAVGRLHTRALTGERFAEGEWIAVLEPALREIYQCAYAFDDAFATARANAHAYAVANGFSADGAVEFAESYAEMNTTANAQSYAYANAVANARAAAAAFARADAEAYAESYPFASVRAWVYACAGQAEQQRAVYERLASGLVESLAGAEPS